MTTYTFIFDINGIADFEERVLKASFLNPVLVDFWADWCGPCLFLDPVLKGVITEYHGKVLLAKLDTEEDENMKLAGRHQVRGFPTVLLIENGQEVARFSSARTKPFVREFIDTNSQLLPKVNSAHP
ncbi:thioredoxin family protein [Thiothrix lacustris]|uniref:Thioredoxin domain-containing protein n=1 Tax=Thiothrix lacustris TaxID=525917 RepID=A0ABY9MNJ6_9GAMM|nr:thioredoxin domain-containing protein [Thiothrix lacustris]WML90152.1 thioredoxin domain-containing protein [Thiothrix lacustris]WMP18251.1 thioredoxin domain-containing protein [Thiothrix lacustris]